MFWSLWAAICVAALCTVRTLESGKPLQREQSDEWKGWMQLMFLLYHYFAEAEIYNAIRVYIAGYVWMTGYGNFSLYLRGNSFTVRRTLQMLFRLNFMVFCVCLGLNNEYMLYYIAPMHTLFTVFVILALYVRSGDNGSRKVLYLKMAVTLALVAALYDGPRTLFDLIFGTAPVIRPTFAFHDPVHPEFADEMHEWHFRSGLDRFVWVIGMVMAMHFPDFEALLTRVGQMDLGQRLLCNAGLLGAAAAVGAAWWLYAFSLDKFAYNALHPFTSAVPIALYILLRNLAEPLRKRYLFLFAYLGRVTLETYILQFHVWMKTTGVNGSPKHLLQVIPFDLPGGFWANFALTSVVYLFVSVRFSKLTMTLRDFMIPEELRDMAVMWGGAAVAAAACWGVAYAVV